MPRRHEALHQPLIEVHWGVPVALSAVVYVGIFVVLPQFCASNACGEVLTLLAPIFSNLAPIFAFVLLMGAASSVLEARAKRGLLDRQSDLESIRRLDWKAIESLIREYYRLRGFRAQENRSEVADGGFAIRLEDSDGLHLVQCKHWRTRQVGAEIVSELYGVMAAGGANSGSVVTCGTFTREAKLFAKGTPMDLVDGARLERMIMGLRRSKGM